MVEDLVRDLRGRAASFRTLNARVRFALGGKGEPDEFILVDARQSPVTVERGDGEADCTIRTSPENLGKLMNGTLDPIMAFTMGKLKVEGSMGLAMKLAGLLEA